MGSEKFVKVLGSQFNLRVNTSEGLLKIAKVFDRKSN